MSNRRQRIEQHPLWIAMESAAQSLGGLDTPGDVSIRGAIDEMQSFLTTARALRTGIDADLAPIAALDTAHNQFSNVSSSLVNYSANPAQPQYLTQAVAYLENVRPHLAGLPRTIGSPAARGAVTRALHEFHDELEASRAQLAVQLETSLDAAKAREDALSENATSLHTALTELEARIGADESRLSDALTSNNETFNAGQTTREGTFKMWLRDQESTFAQLAEPHLSTIKSAATGAEADHDVVSSLRTSTVDMANLASGDILSGQFERHSKAERNASYFAYGLGLLATVAGVLVLLFAFGQVTQALPWQSLVLKLSITGGLGGLAAVGFRYGGKATQRATSFKRQELELRALGPFLAEVNGSEEAKIAFVKRAFGRAWDEGGVSTGTDSADVLSTLTDLVKALTRREPASPD